VGACCAIGSPRLFVSLVHLSPRAHYLGVLRQELYPCFLTKISFFVASRCFRTSTVACRDPAGSPPLFHHYSVSLQANFFCTLKSARSLLLQGSYHLGSSAGLGTNNASSRSFKRMAAGVWRPDARLNGMSALSVSSDSLFWPLSYMQSPANFF
jgi:hypothetical protein